MAHLMVHHRVEDFETWKKVFDEHADERTAAGCIGGELFQCSDDPNDVVIRLSWDTAENARAFTLSKTTREAMARGGVIGEPVLVLLNEPDVVDR
ncbi:MAG: antibiotic biosynthesis monooxygenase [Thermoanaerobaculales bacterium]|jgi:heme-degrading monooxygenase HmoA|nr:antibiotic biosynthesis monooxygenase [Thermoanaerobaculales bacterium]